MFLGIDLGTTNTVVARSFIDAKDNLVTEVVQIGQIYEDNWEWFGTLPSVVYFSNEGIIVGREAKRQRMQDRNHVVANSKRFMGTQKKWDIDGVSYEAKDIAAIILQHCKKTIEREGNMKYNSVVITVPASFSPAQIADTLRAAKQAGFKDDEVTIKHEPTAALLSYIDTETKKKAGERFIDFSSTKRILVFDLGGGTCDTSVIDVKATGNEIFFTEVGIGRYQELGGIDFDSQLASGLLNTFFEVNGILEGDVTEEEKETVYQKLRLTAETLKEKLSAAIQARLSIDGSTDVNTVEAKHNVPQFFRGKPMRIKLNKKQYDEYTKDLYTDRNIDSKKFDEIEKNKNIIGVIRRTLEDFDIPKDSIDYVFMTGGMSKFLTVQEKVGEYIGKPVVMPENPMEAVACGASIYQYYKINEDKKKKESSSSIFSLGDDDGDGDEGGIVDSMMLAEAVLLDVNEGLPKVIIPKKTVVPYSGTLSGAFKTTSPAGIKLNIYAGDSEYDSSLRMEKSLEKEFQFPVESGTPFDIEYNINENKAITMKILIDDKIHAPQELILSIYSDVKTAEKDYDLASGDF